MSFFNPFLAFNMNKAFAMGNYFGQYLGQKIFSSAWNHCDYQNTNPYCGLGAYSQMSYFSPSIFNAYNMNFQQYYNNVSVLNNSWNMNSYGLNQTSNYTSMWSIPSFSTTPTNSSKKLAVNLDGYNKEKGEKLAFDAKSHKANDFTGYCARYVLNALERCNLDDNMGRGNGYQMASLLRTNKNFKEISVESVDWSNLPAGCILCYNKGSQNYSEKAGHVEISTGDGKAVSDGTTHNIRKPDVIFMPV